MLLRLSPALLLLACMGSSAPGTQAPAAIGDTTVQKPKLDRYLFTDSLREIRFLVSTHMHMTQGVQCQVEEITVNKQGDKSDVQHVLVDSMFCPCPTSDGQFPAVQLADFDFDGIRDVRVMKAGPDLTHPAYRYWLWDAKAGELRSAPLLDSIQDVMFDNARQLVSSQWYKGPGHRGGSTYRYENGVLTMVSNMEKFTEGDHERWVIWGMKDGKFQPVQEKEVPLPQH